MSATKEIDIAFSITLFLLVDLKEFDSWNVKPTLPFEDGRFM